MSIPQGSNALLNSYSIDFFASVSDCTQMPNTALRSHLWILEICKIYRMLSTLSITHDSPRIIKAISEYVKLISELIDLVHRITEYSGIFCNSNKYCIDLYYNYKITI